MDATECKAAYTKIYETQSYRGRLDSLLTRDECSALHDAYLASLPRDPGKRMHRYRSAGTGLPAFTVCSCGGELWGRNDPLELNLAAVMGHTLIHYGAEEACGACIKTGIVLMFRAWLLSPNEDRELIGMACNATCECVGRQYLLSASQNVVARDISKDCPGSCLQRALAWCQGMEFPGKDFDMLAGVKGDLDGSMRAGLTSLCNSPDVRMPKNYDTLDPYAKGLTTLYCFISVAGPGFATGLGAPINRWCMINELQSQYDEDVAKETYERTGLPFASWGGPGLNSVLSTRACQGRPVRRTKYSSLEAYCSDRLADGYWIAMHAAVDSPATDDLYLTRDPQTLHEYGIDSVCAFDTLIHPRAIQEDAVYGACSYERQPRSKPQASTPHAFQDILYGAGYIGLTSYVWGANAHLDLKRGQTGHRAAGPSPDHWYARVWHDALLGQSSAGELYRATAITKDQGRFTGDRKFTDCQAECSCADRYHAYGLGATLAWVREAWCGLPCSTTPYDIWMFGAFVDGVRAVLRCGEGRHSPGPERDISRVLPTRKACIGRLSQVRCQIIHLLVWSAVDKESAYPRQSMSELT